MDFAIGPSKPPKIIFSVYFQTIVLPNGTKIKGSKCSALGLEFDFGKENKGICAVTFPDDSNQCIIFGLFRYLENEPCLKRITYMQQY